MQDKSDVTGLLCACPTDWTAFTHLNAWNVHHTQTFALVQATRSSRSGWTPHTALTAQTLKLTRKEKRYRQGGPSERRWRRWLQWMLGRSRRGGLRELGVTQRTHLIDTNKAKFTDTKLIGNYRKVAKVKMEGIIRICSEHRLRGLHGPHGLRV